MKTAKEYASEYRQIASNLGYQGDSVEMLVQMLAHFTYTNEVENIAYTLEGSLERALQPNSKIQLCVEQMYSVFRGRCPRVILRFKPTKFFEFSLYDKVYSGNNFSLYYLGYMPESGSEETNAVGSGSVSEASTSTLNFTYAPYTFQPDGSTITIICLMAKEVIEKSWTMSSTNPYYVDILDENLSSDIWVKIGHVGSDATDYIDTTREFQKHLLDQKMFDLTLPGWSLRLYLPENYRSDSDYTPENTTLKAGVFKLCSLDDFNSYDLGNIKITGGEFVSFSGSSDLPVDLTENSTGVVILSETSREDLSTIHYKANQDRFMGSVLRSNSDVGDLLKEMYPKKVKETSYKFNNVPETVTVDSHYSYYSGGYSLQNNITSYLEPDGEVRDKHLDFPISVSSTKSITINVDTTNSVDPGTVVYSIRTENPVSKISESNKVYVLKTYLDSDSEISSEVVTDLSSEGIYLKYRYSTSDPWSSVDETGIIPERPLKDKEVSSESTSSSTTKSSGTETTTTTDAEGNTSTVTVVTESTGSEENSDSDTSVTSDNTATEPESTEPLQIILCNNTDGIESPLDSEYIPYVTSETTYFGLTDRSYTIPLSRTLDPLISFPQKIRTVLFSSGSSQTADSYEVLSHSKELGVSIDSEGIVSIDSFKSRSIGTYTAVFAANLGALQYTSTLTVNTTATEDSVPRVLQLYYKLSYGTYTLLKEYDVLDSSVVTVTDIQDLIGYSSTESEYTVTLAIDCEKTDTSGVDLKPRYLPVSGTSSANRVKRLNVLDVDTSESDSSYTILSQEATESYSYKTITISSIDVYSSVETVESEQARAEFKPELNIYYIPQDSSDLLSDTEESDFISSRSSYYITDNINVERGNLYNVTLDLNVLLYQSTTTLQSDVDEILGKFTGLFNLDLDSIEEDLYAQISKITDVAKVRSLVLSWRDESNNLIEFPSGTKITDIIDPKTSYLDIISFISTDLI